MTSDAERQFHHSIVAGAARLKREIGYNATRFMQMVGERGGVAAAHALLKGPNASDGFTTLWEHQRLDMSVEAFSLLPWYRELFSDDELVTAEDRLRRHHFDVDRYQRQADQQRPQWAGTD